MLSVVTNILDIGRLRTNKLSFSLEGFDMGALIREVVQMNSSLMESKGVKVSVNIEDGIYIKSDKQRVSQIVTNLYSNAIKYGNGEILIELARNENGFVLTIEDNGRGVADKIGAFELFNTADSDLARSSGGTGVGLNFAKLLSRGLGFELILEDSKKLGGAKFALFGKLSGSEKGVS
jgi:signal transduction histidine kinase